MVETHFELTFASLRKSKIPKIITPTVIALSARLKTGQIRKSKKSITYPKRIRSIRLPQAPPKINDKAKFHQKRWV